MKNTLTFIIVALCLPVFASKQISQQQMVAYLTNHNRLLYQTTGTIFSTNKTNKKGYIDNSKPVSNHDTIFAKCGEPVRIISNGDTIYVKYILKENEAQDWQAGIRVILYGLLIPALAICIVLALRKKSKKI